MGEGGGVRRVQVVVVVVVRVLNDVYNAYALPNAAERNKSFCASVSISYLREGREGEGGVCVSVRVDGVLL